MICVLPTVLCFSKFIMQKDITLNERCSSLVKLTEQIIIQAYISISKMCFPKRAFKTCPDSFNITKLNQKAKKCSNMDLELEEKKGNI